MEKEKHPPGLFVLFFTEMWERFGFYSMLAMFTLYLKNDRQGFGWSAEDATTIYSNYLMFVYAAPLIGGWIADKKLGYRNSVLLGGVIFMVGYFLLAIHDIVAVYAALTCLVIANGFFKPNVSAMVGHLYREGSPLKDRAYNIFYMGINIGALLAPINAEIMVHWIGFNKAFAIAGFGMIISVAILWRFRRHVVGADSEAQQTDPQTAGLGQPAVSRPPNPMESVPEGKRIGALIVIFIIAIVFWMVFHQNGSTLTYWADDNTDWKVSGIISNAINPFWVVTLTFPLVWFWRWLDSKGMEPSTPTKIALGMFLCAGSFCLLYAAARTGESKEVTSEMLASPKASFRVTDRGLDFMKADGVPEDVVKQLREGKDAQGKPIVRGKKFSTDTTFQEALETIKQDLRSVDLSEQDRNLLKDTEFDKDVQETKLDGDDRTQFAAALDKLIASLQKDGLSEKAAEEMRKHNARTFTAEGKLWRVIRKALPKSDPTKEKDTLYEKAVEHRQTILTRSYLFQVSPLWLIFAYMIVTLAELMLSPMGLSLVSKVAPVRLRGVMMGGWFVATAIGNKLTMIGVFWDKWMQSTFFIVLAGMAFVMGVVLVCLLRPLKKAMPGV